MGFFKKIKKFALPTIGAIIGSALLPGVGTSLGASIGSAGGAAIGSGLGTLAAGGSVKDSLLSGVGSYAGGQIAGSFGGSGSTIGTATGMSSLPWSAANTGLGQSIGSLVGQSTANSIAGTGLNTAIGSLIGSDFAQNAFGDNEPAPQMSAALPAAPAGPAPFKAQQDAEKDLPSSLTGAFGSLAPDQRNTGIANQGVYGSGNGPQEQEYYVNQAQRRLVDPMGNVGDPNAIFNPIEQSYLSKLGLGGYSSGTNLAELISKWKAA